MWLPPMWTLRSGLRAWRSNSGGAFATCSRIQSGSKLDQLAFDLLAGALEDLDRLGVQELDPELADDAPPAAFELGQRSFVEDFVAG